MVSTKFAFGRVGSVGGVAALLALAGCKVGPDYKAPAPPAQPQAWHAVEVKPEPLPEGLSDNITTQVKPGGSTSELSRWWKEFDDPLLDSLVTRALSANPDLRLATARVLEARALRGVARGPLAPQVDATGQATRNRGSETINGGTFFNEGEYSLFGVGLDASWEIDLWGGIRRGLEAADADLAGAEENRRAVMVTLIADVARNYAEARGYQRRIAVAREAIRVQEESVQVAEARLRAGISPELDRAQATAQLETRRSQVPPLKTGYWAAVHRLSILLGQEPAALASEMEQEGAILVPPAYIGVGVPSEILLRRPDIRRAERALAGETARIGVATADLYPRLTLNGSFGLQSANVGTLIDANSRAFSFGPGVRWNIFDYGRVRSTINAAGAREQQALANYDATVLSAFEEVENRIVAFTQEQSRRAALDRAVRSNERAVVLSNDLYKAQLRDFLYVLDSQRELYDSQDALVQSDVAVTTNIIGLYRALGGGWQDAMFTPAPPPGMQQDKPLEKTLELESNSGGPGHAAR